MAATPINMHFGPLMRSPSDVFAEILSHVQPNDLLTLCRTCKIFRRHLLDDKKKFIWQRAQENFEGLPPCPEDISEPAYASLVFDSLYGLVKYFRLHAEVLQAEYEQYGADAMSHREEWWQNRWMNKPDTAAKLEHAALCEAWAKQLVAGRKQERRSVFEVRYEQIIEKLTALGYGPEIEFLAKPENAKEYGSLEKLPLVNRSTKLTQQAWKNMLPSITTHLEEVRNFRYISERREGLVARLLLFNQFYAAWRRAQKPGAILPQALHLARRPEIRNIVAGPDCPELTVASFTIFDIRSWAHEWYLTCTASLRTHFQKRLKVLSENPFQPFTISPFVKHELELATTVWICSACTYGAAPKAPLHYPEVLTHSCLSRKIPAKTLEKLLRVEDEWEYAVAAVNGYSGWSPEPLVLWGGRDWASDVVRACGQDPSSATKAAMDKLNVRLMCKNCAQEQKKAVGDKICTREVFTWRAAIRHYHEHEHQFSKDIRPTQRLAGLDWERVPEDHMPLVCALEQKATAYYDPTNVPLWREIFNNRAYWGPFCCAYCPEGYMSQDQINTHMTTW
ncbi:hypothetical protein EIP86_010752 [Pleurotus ostreatoroseus]|nr:hypothetical protein EIP86_010752 [Pleurotus ostreatoroseus]